MRSRNRAKYKHLFMLSHQVRRMQKQIGDEVVKIGTDGAKSSDMEDAEAGRRSGGEDRNR